MTKLLDFLDKQLNTFQTQKRRWMVLSLTVIALIAFIVIEWRDLNDANNMPIWIGILIFMIILSATWWYWTMSLVQKLLDSRRHEYTILKEMYEDIVEIKKDITRLR
jgi:hypothetical protein